MRRQAVSSPAALPDHLRELGQPIFGKAGEPDRVVAHEVFEGEGRPLEFMLHETLNGLLDPEHELPHAVLPHDPVLLDHLLGRYPVALEAQRQLAARASARARNCVTVRGAVASKLFNARSATSTSVCS